MGWSRLCRFIWGFVSGWPSREERRVGYWGGKRRVGVNRGENKWG